jgi:hypothetical protein
MDAPQDEVPPVNQEAPADYQEGVDYDYQEEKPAAQEEAPADFQEAAPVEPVVRRRTAAETSCCNKCNKSTSRSGKACRCQVRKLPG